MLRKSLVGGKQDTRLPLLRWGLGNVAGIKIVGIIGFHEYLPEKPTIGSILLV